MRNFHGSTRFKKLCCGSDGARGVEDRAFKAENFLAIDAVDDAFMTVDLEFNLNPFIWGESGCMRRDDVVLHEIAIE